MQDSARQFKQCKAMQGNMKSNVNQCNLGFCKTNNAMQEVIMHCTELEYIVQIELKIVIHSAEASWCESVQGFKAQLCTKC